MPFQGWSWWLSVALLLISCCLPAHAQMQQLESRQCLGCHGMSGFNIAGRSLHIDATEFSRSVHKSVNCIACHREIDRIPHQALSSVQVDCISCHQNKWQQAQLEANADQYLLLGKVVAQIAQYKKSVHAQPNKLNPAQPNAYCSDCHQAHYTAVIFSDPGNPGRLKIPDICGRCHAEQRAAYAQSVHGVALLQQRNAYAAVCVDCHNTHAIQNVDSDIVKQSVTQNCGNCHEHSQQTYRASYHGQMHTLGENRTAKCFNCHGSHNIKRVNDPSSMVHQNQRLQTCAQCHREVGAGFNSYAPHADVQDRTRSPMLYWVNKILLILIWALLLGFTVHNLLWLWAAHRERVQKRAGQHIDLKQLAGEKYIYHFGQLWRVIHLLLAIAVLLLILTGMALLYAASSWVTMVVQLLGGAAMTSLLHRGCGLLLLMLLLVYLSYLAVYLMKKRTHWQQWRQHSILFNKQDGQHLCAMWHWFFDHGEKPSFDRWAYWQKFDFWAMLCSLTVLALTGAMMWLPELTAHYLPGWIFNLNALIHGELAFLATLMLLVVHISNSYIGAGSLIGCMPLHEYQQQYALSYQHLLASGKLQRYLLEPPGKMLRWFSAIVAWALLLLVTFELMWIIKEFVG